MPASLLARAACVADLKKRARRRVPRFAFDYLEGGCNQEIAIARNRSALDAIVMEPRYLEDCAAPDLSVSLFGRRYDAPFGVAPVGLGGLIWPRAAEYLAEAAGRANIPFCLSTVATTSIERAAELAGECLWFQLYTPTDPVIRDDLLDRAAAVGCRVLLVTIDVPGAAWRPRDLRNGLSVPPRFDLRTLLQIAARPVWAMATLRAGIPRFDSVRPYMPRNVSVAGSSVFTRTTFTGGLHREALARIRDRWQGPMVLKGGVETVREAELALQLGAEGIVVSNHGGRQLDASRSPVEVLPQIRAAVGDRMTVLADSGVESGADIGRMLAKGALSVLAGRAFVYGVGALGRAGAAHTIEMLREELARFMAQLRCARPEELARHLPQARQRDAGEQPMRPHAVA
jgi:isopentenyl diphosphate isomerase/L-lactate dehydrogenase-like FMN-dependent dehydrogenase